MSPNGHDRHKHTEQATKTDMEGIKYKHCVKMTTKALGCYIFEFFSPLIRLDPFWGPKGGFLAQSPTG